MKKRITIGIDLDGVLRDFAGTVIKLTNYLYDTNFDVKEVTSWDFSNDLIKEKLPAFDMWEMLKRHKSRLEDADYYPNGVKLFEQLRLTFPDDNVWIVTDQITEFRKLTLEWIIRTLPIQPTGIIFSFYKDKCKLPLDCMLDDRAKVILDCCKAGITSILWSQPWNTLKNPEQRTFYSLLMQSSKVFQSFHRADNAEEVIKIISSLKEKA